MQATARKLKRSFTLTPESVAFVSETRQQRRAGSDSEALDLLLRESMLEAKSRQLDLATKAYYDTASDEELAEQREWAERSGPNMVLDMDSAEAQS
jgi:alpha-mannosidase